MNLRKTSRKLVQRDNLFDWIVNKHKDEIAKSKIVPKPGEVSSYFQIKLFKSEFADDQRETINIIFNLY